MKATELRIGDWVIHKGKAKQVNGLERDHHYTTPIWFFALSDGDYSDEDDITPIPLDETVLAKCGIKMHSTPGIVGLDETLLDETTYYWDIDLPRDKICDGGTLTLVRWGDGEPIYASMQWIRRRLDSLHELQNIYNAITGRELTYTP